MVYANRAIDAGDFFQSIGRYIGDEDLEVWPVVRKITETIRKYDTPMLFKQFGRKKFKDERMFLQKVEEAYIREDIRPYIDKYVAQVLDELTEAGCPLFLKTSRLDNFYIRSFAGIVEIRKDRGVYPLYFAFDRWRKDLLSQ